MATHGMIRMSTVHPKPIRTSHQTRLHIFEISSRSYRDHYVRHALTEGGARYLKKYYQIEILLYFVFKDWLIVQFYVNFYQQKLLFDQTLHLLGGQKTLLKKLQQS